MARYACRKPGAQHRRHIVVSQKCATLYLVTDFVTQPSYTSLQTQPQPGPVTPDPPLPSPDWPSGANTTAKYVGQASLLTISSVRVSALCHLRWKKLGHQDTAPKVESSKSAMFGTLIRHSIRLQGPRKPLGQGQRRVRKYVDRLVLRNPSIGSPPEGFTFEPACVRLDKQQATQQALGTQVNLPLFRRFHLFFV